MNEFVRFPRWLVFVESFLLGIGPWVALPVDAATLHVWLDSPKPTLPFATWDTAATNIQQAIDAAEEGDTVLVTNGVYRAGSREVMPPNQEWDTRVPCRVVITNAIVLRSVNGAGATIIDGEADVAVLCAYVGARSLLSGFTLTHGYAGVWCERLGAVKDCTISGNGLGGGAYGGTLSNCTLASNRRTGATAALLYNCTLIGNYQWGPYEMWGGGVARCTLYNCFLSGNRAYCGGAAFDSTLYSCALIGNGASYGGGTYECTLYNCTLTGNAALWGGGAWGGKLYSCIVYFNRSETGIDANYPPSEVETTFENSCTTPLPPGPGNIAADPWFVSGSAGDFRLRPDSACIDAGSNRADIGSSDLLGAPRIRDGNSDGIDRVDMGAHEFDPTFPFITRFKFTSDGLRLEWLGTATGARLQRSKTLAVPDWQDVPGSVGTNAMALPMGDTTGFFRLVR